MREDLREFGVFIVGVLLFLTLLALLIPLGSADNEEFDDVNYNLFTIYNVSNITAQNYCNATNCYPISDLVGGGGGGSGNITGTSGQCIYTSGNNVVLNMTCINSTTLNNALLAGLNSTFNATYDSWAYNQTDAAKTYTNTVVNGNYTELDNLKLNQSDQRYNDTDSIFWQDALGILGNAIQPKSGASQDAQATNLIAIVKAYSGSGFCFIAGTTTCVARNALSTNMVFLWNNNLLLELGQYQAIFHNTSVTVGKGLGVTGNGSITGESFTVGGDEVCRNDSTNCFNYTVGANSYTDNQISSVNTTGNIQNLLNSTGIYSTYNATYHTYAYNQTPTAGSNISVSGTEVSVDTTALKNWLDGVYCLLAGCTLTGPLTVEDVANITGNFTHGDSNVVHAYNGSCYNTYVGGTLVQSIGCA